MLPKKDLATLLSKNNGASSNFAKYRSKEQLLNSNSHSHSAAEQAFSLGSMPQPVIPNHVPTHSSGNNSPYVSNATVAATATRNGKSGTLVLPKIMSLPSSALEPYHPKGVLAAIAKPSIGYQGYSASSISTAHGGSPGAAGGTLKLLYHIGESAKQLYKGKGGTDKFAYVGVQKPSNMGSFGVPPRFGLDHKVSMKAKKGFVGSREQSY